MGAIEETAAPSTDTPGEVPRRDAQPAAVAVDLSPDIDLDDAVAALQAGQYRYTPPRSGPALTLARFYVARRSWLPPVTAVLVLAVLAVGGYFLAYVPFHNQQAELARVELHQTMPAQMDALYETIFDETKVQQAATDAASLRDRGKAAAGRGDRAAAVDAIADLKSLRDTLRQEYRLMVVDQPGVDPTFWTFPPNNNEATNYYIVVEAVDATGQVISLPVLSEDTGRVDTVNRWGLRVTEDVYRSVAADKRDDGSVENAVVAIKQFGFIDPDYLVDVLGGAVTHW
ncbi:MAG TPA: DUF6384 family protein [Devosia sp.]|nr:DUF6384 family protein [Devosia sp.]